MNHKWVENKSFKPHDGFYKKDKCSRCGCSRTTHKKIGSFYERSGMDFGFSKMPECLDWNDNTLD